MSSTRLTDHCPPCLRRRRHGYAKPVVVREAPTGSGGEVTERECMRCGVVRIHCASNSRAYPSTTRYRVPDPRVPRN